MGRTEASNLQLEDIESPRSRSSSEISTTSYNCSSPRSRSSSAVSYNSTTDSEDQDYHTRHCPGDVEIPNRVFVKGFDHETTEEDLKSFFEIYGVVHEAKIVKDRNAGNSKGYAFISFDSQRIAEKVRTMGHVPYKDREIVIGPAKIRKKRPIFAAYSPPAEVYPSYWHVVPPSPQPAFGCSPSPTENVLYYYPTAAVPVLPPPPPASQIQQLSPPATPSGPLQYHHQPQHYLHPSHHASEPMMIPREQWGHAQEPNHPQVKGLVPGVEEHLVQAPPPAAPQHQGTPRFHLLANQLQELHL